MNVNGINPEEIRAKAQSLLQNKQKVDLGKEDLELLLENARLDKGDALFENVSDDDAVAMFDFLDNEGNTAEASYDLIMKWLQKQSGFVDTTPPAAEDTPSVTPSEGSGSTPVVNPPAEEPSGSSETEQPGSGEEIPSTGGTTPAEETQEPGETTPDEGSGETPPVDETPTGDEPATPGINMERQFASLMSGEEQVISVGDKQYKVENSSSTINNFVYYVENGQLIIEGSDLKVFRNAGNGENEKDNVRVLGNRNTVDMGDGDDVVDIEGAMNIIYGGSGDDFIKVRGDYNTVDMSTGDDVVWFDGKNNNAFGQGGDDNFFAIGEKNNFHGQDGTDASYYNETQGVGQQFRIEETIAADDPRAKAFEDWVNGTEPSGPPYTKPPTAEAGHEVRAYYDKGIYSDMYEESPLIKTDYKDIAYREMQAHTEEDKSTGDGKVEFYEAEGNVVVEIAPSGDVKIAASNGSSTEYPAASVRYLDESGDEVQNPGTMASLLDKLAKHELTIDIPVYIDTATAAKYLEAGIPQFIIDQGEEAVKQYAEENGIELPT